MKPIDARLYQQYANLSRGDLAGRLAATLNKWLKRPGLKPVCIATGFFV